ncbi:hypothetical protein BWD09_12760 [Neisseria dentiae]|uniref:Uncharacterized protein n=1 Tax=Neisseria dentiae TaxID=194197 RepID=A0A1X3D1F5_9NEIS|nr:hypothetical protein [Neisseria dentiae]OSI13718.1 hypothetical protein BWD09_12760 [Neisseria dentiae]QMT44912.1 hypothetical protein H3L92_10900 [Neisseria dentiae]STZ50648.1 Uncharacterised protein [Neisseria dentiae]
MSVKSGRYAIYNGKEYRISKIDGHYEIISNDEKDLEKGFIEYKPEKKLNPRIFFKIVIPSEIKEVYAINTYAIYKGFEFPVRYEEEGEYILVADYSPLIEKLQFDRVDKYGYEKKVKKEELDLVFEKKTLRPNFFK